MPRRRPVRKILDPTPTIIGAGITEQYYFKHLQSLLGLKVKIRPRFFGSEKTSDLEKRIEQVLKAEGVAIVVFDTDVSQWDDKEAERLKRLKAKYSNSKRVVLCDSMPSIEFWFLLHYCDVRRHFGTSDAAIKELLKYIPNFCKHKSFLKNPKWVSDLLTHVNDAYNRAINIDELGNSYTNLWKAFHKLLPERFLLKEK